MSNPLFPSYLRVARAQAHLAEAIRLIIPALDENLKREMDEIDIDLSTLRLNNETGLIPIVGPISAFPAMVPLLIGEFTQNLRIALDYLVFELAKHDSDGVEQEGTQFPIDDKPEVFATHSTRVTPKGKTNKSNLLPGLAQHHIDAIEALQPFKGVRWTKELRELSNPDKHRKLYRMASNVNLHVRTTTGPPGMFDNSPKVAFRTDIYRIQDGTRTFDLQVEMNGISDIHFENADGLIVPIMPVLFNLVEDVSRTLEQFEVEFQ